MGMHRFRVKYEEQPKLGFFAHISVGTQFLSVITVLYRLYQFYASTIYILTDIFLNKILKNILTPTKVGKLVSLNECLKMLVLIFFM